MTTTNGQVALGVKKMNAKAKLVVNEFVWVLADDGFDVDVRFENGEVGKVPRRLLKRCGFFRRLLRK